MAAVATSAPQPAPRKRGWLRKLLYVFVALVVLMVAAWFILTSDAFFKGTIIPRIGKAMNGTMSAEAASISPFSQVTMRGLKFLTVGDEPLLTAGEVRARYDLMAILRGTVKVDEVLIDSPVVTVVENADGTRNTDKLPKGEKDKKESTEAPQVDLKQFLLKNATVRYIKHHPGGTRDLVEISGLNITLADVKNGAAGKLDFALAGKVELNPPNPEQRGALVLKHDGKYTFTLGPDLIPTQINGSDRTDITQATGALANFADAGVDMVADMAPTEVKNIALTFRKGGTALGELRLSGPFDSMNREGKLNLVLTGVDRKLLNLFGAPAGIDFGSTAIHFSNVVEFAQGGNEIKLAGQLGARDLQIIQSNQPSPTLQIGTDYGVALQTKPDNTTQIAGRLTVGEIVSRTGTNELRVPPTGLEFEVTQSATVTELKSLLVTLAKSDRAKNELTLAGRVDATKPEAITGGFKLTAESLDVTSYYDLFVGGPAKGKPEPKPAEPAGPDEEPEAITIPFKNFTFDANVGHVYLREVDVADLKASARVDGARMSVKPLEFALNGAPVKGSAEVNLGVAGFEYEFSLDAPGVPLAPLVNSFQPERKGQVAGTSTLSAQLKGAGLTGANLQKNLSGQFDLVTTNLNLPLKELRSPVLKTVVNVVVAIPDAIRNPVAAAGQVLGGILGVKRESSGWTDELMKSPVNAIAVHGTVGGGKFELKQSYIESSAFHGEATGTVEIAPVLTNSVMHFPVTVSLSKDLADKIGLTPSDTPTNAVYVPLPQFFQMRGTVGQPKPQTDYTVIAKMALKSLSGVGGNIGGAAGETATDALKAVGGLLGGGRTNQTNSNDVTNAPSTNSPANIIRGLGDFLNRPKKPATNPPPETK